MRRLLALCALLFVVPAVAQDDPVKGPEIPAEKVIEHPLPPPSPGKLSREKRDAPAVFVRLEDGGQLKVKDGKEWKDVNMAEFGTRLRAKLTKEGKSGLEDLPGGGKASKLFVSIEADPKVPWQHLQWLMTIAVEQHFRKLELSDGKRRLLAFLPINEPNDHIPQKPPNEVKVRVHIVVKSEETAKWGDVGVSRPTEIVYRFSDLEVARVESVAVWIQHGKKAAAGEENTIVVGEIRTGHKVPFATVLDVMETFLDQGVPSVALYGTSIPGRELRKLAKLPYPKRNYPRR